MITDGGQTQTDSYSSGSTLNTTETDGLSDTLDDATSDEAGNDTNTGSDSGSATITTTDTAASQGTDTLTESLGADGTIASGQESDSLSESSGDTTTETDHPTETLTDSATDSTMTLTATVTTTETDNESDQDWAVETLGTSGTIASGSDCFTVNNLDTSAYVSSGSGPENYNDTSGSPNGTATVTGSGSSSNLTHQTFGDVLGVGGDISSGSLSYTVSSSDTDAATTTESGTETIADELSDGTSQTASYDVSSTLPDTATAYETGTETLGGGGTISGGSASFTWFDGNALGRDLTITGISATLSITEDSTDTYGFGESGTESITTGGADAPGTVSFVWNQMGTDSYVIDQGSSYTWSNSYHSFLTAYSFDLTDTVSSSWHDAGADLLTNGDSVTGETDNYTWSDLNSVTYGVMETETTSPGASSDDETYTHDGLDSFSLADTGSESLGTDASDSTSLTVVAESDQFDIEDSFADGLTISGAWYEDGATWYGLATESDGFNLNDAGNDSISGSLSSDTYSYQLSQYVSAPAAYGLWYQNSGDSDLWPVGGATFDDFEENGTESGSPDSFATSLSESYASVDVNDFYEEGLFHGPFTWSSTGSNPTDHAGVFGLARPEDGVQGILGEAEGGLLSVVGNDQLYSSEVSTSSSHHSLSLDRFGWRYSSSVPASVPLYLSASALDLGVAGPGYLPTLQDYSYAGVAIFPFTPLTNAATANGLPNQEASALGNMAQNQGPPDGVSRSAPPSPTAVLTALAAAGRNPTDLTIPTVGSQAGGSGGDSPDTAGTTVTAASGGITADGTGSGGGGDGTSSGSHEQGWVAWAAGGVGSALRKADQLGGAAASFVLTGSANTGESGSLVRIIWEGDKGVLQGGANTLNGARRRDRHGESGDPRGRAGHGRPRSAGHPLTGLGV